jgi:protein ImuA
MIDSHFRLAQVKRRIEALARPARSQGGSGLFALGAEALDARLGGGLARGALHEVMAKDVTSASGFALMLALRAGVIGKPLLWVVNDKNERLHGGVYAPGLVDLGANPDDIVMVHAPDELAALRAAADIMACGAVGAAILDMGEAKKLDLTASRRLALAAEKSGVTGFVLRQAGSSFASAASTRWQVAAAPSIALSGAAPGQTALQLELLRHRGGIAPFEMKVEWDCETRCFYEPDLSGAVLPVSRGRSLDTRAQREGGARAAA